ncbi:MAG: SIS domain-containing protein [Chloroflexota bacterium]|nr:SIS domain-containing protein [Chloroflexota bacterium]
MRYLHQNTSIFKFIANQLVRAFQRGNKVLLFGNGSSAANAEHFTDELIGRLRHDCATLAVIVLTANTARLTTIANDFGYDTVF